MYTLYTLCLSNIRRRKIQNGLIAVLIMLATLLLATAITIILNTENLFEKKHKEMNGSHQILTMGNDLHNPQIVNKWWTEQDGVTASSLMPFRHLSGVEYNGNEIPNIYLYMMNTPQEPFTVDKLTLSEEEKQVQPELGTMWIPTSMANLYGISIGDNLEFNTGKRTFKLRVSDIVIDIPFGGPFTVNARIWMNERDYEEQFQTVSGGDQYMMGLRFDDYSQRADYWEEFEEYLDSPYLESKTEYESMASFYLIINKVIGFIMIFLGAIMMLVALFIIGFSISDAILSNYKTIGVIKSLGLTSRRVIGTYVLQYGLLSIVSIISGLLISSILSRLIIESSLSTLKTGNTIENADFIHSLLIGVIVFIIVILTALFYSNKTRSVEPVQAIRYGMSEWESTKMARRLMSSNKILHFGRLPLHIQIGCKNLSKNMKSSVVMVVLTTLTSAILVFGFVFLNSIISVKQTVASWGYDAANIAVIVYNESVFSKEKFEKELVSDPRIKNFGSYSDLTGVIPPERGSQSLNINIGVLEGSYEELGFETIRGDNPKNRNEIAIGINVAKDLNKELGDVMDVYIEGKKHTLIITGIYQAISNMSYSARITVDVTRENNPHYKIAGTVYINLVDVGQSDQVVSELSEKFKESISAVTQQTLLDTVFKEAVSILLIPISAMGIMFVSVTFIIIYSISRINVRKESHIYGIYKSIGMTSSKIRWSITFGIAILSAIGALLGVVLGIHVLPLSLKGILLDYGLVELPLVVNLGMSIGVACFSIVAACFGCWLSTRVIAKTSPRILLVE